MRHGAAQNVNRAPICCARDVYPEKEGDRIEAGVMNLVQKWASGPKIGASVTKSRKIGEKCAKNAQNPSAKSGYGRFVYFPKSGCARTIGGGRRCSSSLDAGPGWCGCRIWQHAWARCRVRVRNRVRIWGRDRIIEGGRGGIRFALRVRGGHLLPCSL